MARELPMRIQEGKRQEMPNFGSSTRGAASPPSAAMGGPADHQLFSTQDSKPVCKHSSSRSTGVRRRLSFVVFRPRSRRLWAHQPKPKFLDDIFSAIPEDYPGRFNAKFMTVPRESWESGPLCCCVIALGSDRGEC